MIVTFGVVTLDRGLIHVFNFCFIREFIRFRFVLFYFEMNLNPLL